MTTDDTTPPATLLHAVLDWQAGELPREALVSRLSSLTPEQGEQVTGLLAELHRRAGRAPAAHAAHDDDTASWREELMACRARTWPFPQAAGLLVGPSVLILTDGARGLVLRERMVRPLPMSVSSSLLLLCQTIVMAQHAVDRQELGQLRQQRIESSSTSLSEIEIIR